MAFACAANRNAVARSEPPDLPQVSSHDSLALDLNDMPLSPYPLPIPDNHSAKPSLFEPTGISRTPLFTDNSFRPDLPVPSLLAPAFVMPDRDLFIAYDSFRRQQGIAIPSVSVNTPRMILSADCYMPMVVRGDHMLGIAGSQKRYPSMAFSNSASVVYSWAPADGITFYGNLHASDNIYHLSRFKDIGVSGRARVRLTDGIWINGYGNYTLYNNSGPQQMPMGLYLTNSFGGTIEVRITDKFGLEGGVMREYDPFQRRWVTNPYVMPVFY